MIPNPNPTLMDQAMILFDATMRGSGSWANWPTMPGSHIYAIEQEGQLYPVKCIISIATGDPVGHFYGGKGGGRANEIARGCGCTVVII